jgi:hypothetical protein
MLAYVQATGDQGEVEIDFSAPWLKSAKVSLTVGREAGSR